MVAVDAIQAHAGSFEPFVQGLFGRRFGRLSVAC
jgi:hypothetical protein